MINKIRHEKKTRDKFVHHPLLIRHSHSLMSFTCNEKSQRQFDIT